MGVRVVVNTRLLEKFAKEFRPAVARELNKANESLHTVAIELAPRKTGALADSIHIDEVATAAHLQATTIAGDEDVDYAPYVEYGFHHYRSGEWISPQPFMHPAYMLAKRQLIAGLEMLSKLGDTLGLK